MKTVLGLVVAAMIIAVSGNASASWFFACEGAYSGSTACSSANYRWVEVGTATPSSMSIFAGSDAACNYGWQPHDFTGTITYAALCPTNPGSGNWCTAGFSCTSMTISGADPTCTTPQVLQNHVCAACPGGTYYSGGACVAEPTCTAPQILDAVNHVCVNPDPTCVLPQVLQNHVCVTPDPTCTLPQVLDPVNHVCYTPAVTCTPPQVLQGSTCITPTVVGDCVPSIRTVGDCPAGYAPSSAALGQNLDSYTGGFDGMPLQDMIYATGMALCALIGIAVGVRLV